MAQLAVLSSSKRLLADAGAPAVLAPAPDAAMLADVEATAVLAPAPLAVMVADSVLVSPQSFKVALAPLAVVLADAGAPAVDAPAPDAVMLADAGAPAETSLVPLEVVLDFFAPPPRLRCAHPLVPVEGAAGALGAEEDGRAADGLAAHGAGKGAVEQRVAAGGERRGRWHVVLRLRHGLMTVD